MIAGFAIPSYAATLDFTVIPSYENKTLKVMGTSDAGRMLTFYVTDQGISAAAMTFDNNIYAIHQETVGMDGSFNFTLNLPETMGEGTYKIIVGGLGVNYDEALRSSDFEYVATNGKAYILEAENASGLTKWGVHTDQSASGGKYVSMYEDNITYDFSDAKITFTFESEDAL